jgi:hypothetical protein
MSKRITLADLAHQAGGEPIAYRGKYLMVRWGSDDVRLESRKTLEQACNELQAHNEMTMR